MPRTVWESSERVYETDADGEPVALKYAIGDPIPYEEAVRQGLVTADERKKVSAEMRETLGVEDKKVDAGAAEDKGGDGNGTGDGEQGEQGGGDAGAGDGSLEEPPAVEPLDVAALEGMTRGELDEKAATLGVEGADKLPNKKAVIASIVKAHAASASA